MREEATWTQRRGSLASVIALCVVTGAPAAGEARTVKAAVLRSQGTQFLGMTIWPELNAGWSQFGNVPVQIDYTSLAGYDWTADDIAATGADVLIFSTPGFLHHTDAEINAIIDYVQAGHGLIITYDDFLYNRRALAPLVGLSEAIRLGTSAVSDPMYFDLLFPSHPLFARVSDPYMSGVAFQAWPAWTGQWLLDGGTVLANMYTQVIPPDAGIIVKETPVWRGVYFSHYIENKADGANFQDMQVFYNALVWAGTPEPGGLLLALAGTALLVRKRRRR